MPWITIIIWVVSFILAKKNDRSTGEAALVATGAAAAAYYTVEPTNEDAIWGDVTRDVFDMEVPDADALPNGTSVNPVGDNTTVSTTDNGTPGAIATVAETCGSVLESWGPAGTSGVIATTAGASSGIFSSKIIWIAIAIGAFMILDD